MSVSYDKCDGCGKYNIRRVTASDGSLSSVWHGGTYCEDCKKTKSPTGMQKGVQELGESVTQLGKTAAGAGGALINNSVGDGARQVGAVGAQISQAGLEATTEAFKQGGILGGISMGIGFFMGPGLAGVIALVASEIWCLVLGEKIWAYDWFYGILYYLITGGGLLLAIFPAMGIIYLCVHLSTPKNVETPKNKEEVGKNIAKFSAIMVGVSIVLDIICVVLGIWGWGVL